MPKIFGTSLIGILAATLVFYMLGFIWYGFAFAEQWMSLNGITAAEAQLRNEQLGAMLFVWGLLISLLQVLGLAAVINWAGASVLVTCAKIGLTIGLLIAVPILGYGVLYAGSPVNLMLIDAAHLVLGYVLIGIVLSFFRKD